MNRRNFVRALGSCSVLGLTAGASLVSLDAIIPNAVETKGSLQNFGIRYVHQMPAFQNIVSILSRYGSFRIAIQADSRSDDRSWLGDHHLVCDLVSMNSSYGRWGFFDFAELEARLLAAPELKKNIFIETRGPAGQWLRKQTDLSVIAKALSPDPNLWILGDATPHYYNTFFDGEASQGLTYFVDSVSRVPVQVKIVSPEKFDLSTLDQIEISRLQAEIQAAFRLYEQLALDHLKQHFKVRDFQEILAFGQSSIWLQSVALLKKA